MLSRPHPESPPDASGYRGIMQSVRVQWAFGSGSKTQVADAWLQSSGHAGLFRPNVFILFRESARYGPGPLGMCGRHYNQQEPARLPSGAAALAADATSLGRPGAHRRVRCVRAWQPA